MIFLIFLTQYFNEALSTSQIPSTDKELVGAIPVRKEIKQPLKGNLRAVNALQIFSKIFAKTLHDQFLAYFDNTWQYLLLLAHKI